MTVIAIAIHQTSITQHDLCSMTNRLSFSHWEHKQREMSAQPLERKCECTDELSMLHCAGFFGRVASMYYVCINKDIVPGLRII